MTEINDYSGPFDPNLTFNDLSKDFLLKVIRVWQWSWLQLDAAWFDEVKARWGREVGYGCDLEMWLRCAERCNTRYAKIAKIPNKNVIDVLKVLQMPLDNTMGAVYPTKHEIRDENYAVVTVEKCPSLEWCERNDPERIVPMCVIMEPHLIHWYKVNTDVVMAATQLPPRKSPDDIACRWEYVYRAPKGAKVRTKEELVDETTTPPEIDDQSGSYYPHLTHANFSKPFLLKMMYAWQYAWLVMNEGYYLAVMKRYGSKLADEIEQIAWVRVAERCNRRYAAVANTKLNTVTDSLKILQLTMDSAMGYFPARYQIKSPTHVIMSIGRASTPDFLDNAVAQRTPPMYHAGGKPVMEKYLVNPKIKVTPLRLPPRNEYDDIHCEWDLKIEE